MGIGSKLKRAVRKIIPNELAEVASAAAPLVAPFNPAVAAAMAGLGSFDKTGRIGSSVKAGLGTYALGQGARYLGGAGFQGNPFASGGAFTGQGFTGGFSSPFGTETGIGSLFRSDPVSVADNPYALQGEGAYSFDTLPEAKQVSSGSFVTSQPQVGFEAGQVDPQLARAAGLDTTSTATQAATSTKGEKKKEAILLCSVIDQQTFITFSIGVDNRRKMVVL
jgi:hypothetical protein